MKSPSVERFEHWLLSEIDGSAIVTFALCLGLLTSVVGAALDFGRTYSAKRKLQAALDDSVILVASFTDADRLDKATTLFRENFQKLGLTGPDPEFSIDQSGQAVAAANLLLKTSFLQLLGMPTLPVTATSTATSHVSNVAKVTFTPVSAQGWFAKDIYAFVRNSSGTIVNEVKVLSYDYDYATNAKVLSPPPGTATQTFTMGGGSTFGVKMRVWQDYTNIGSRAGPYVDFFSDDPAPEIRMSGDCANGQTHEWEDGGDKNYKDFIYTMTCTSMIGRIAGVRLVR